MQFIKISCMPFVWKWMWLSTLLVLHQKTCVAPKGVASLRRILFLQAFQCRKVIALYFCREEPPPCTCTFLSRFEFRESLSRLMGWTTRQECKTLKLQPAKNAPGLPRCGAPLGFFCREERRSTQATKPPQSPGGFQCSAALEKPLPPQKFQVSLSLPMG